MALKYKLILSNTDPDLGDAGAILDGYCRNGSDLAKIATNAAAMLSITQDIAKHANDPPEDPDAES